jgi:hypothetical protein
MFRCYNPIEIGVLGFIISTACFQMILLFLFLFSNFWEYREAMKKIEPQVT